MTLVVHNVNVSKLRLCPRALVERSHDRGALVGHTTKIP
jgi:hypothetical protein